MYIYNDVETQKKISECLSVLCDILGKDLLGAYLHGPAVVGGLKSFSDIDIFVISNRATTFAEKENLVDTILKISGVYKKSQKRPMIY